MPVVLRPAERRDAAELAVLIDIASHSFATWLWYGGVLRGESETAMEHGRARMRDDRQQGGWRDAVIAEIGGDVAGLAVGYRLDETVATAPSDHPALEPLLVLQRPLAGHWFVDSLAVYRRHRRYGIGRQLMDDQIARSGGGPVSLITESYNDAAQALYGSLGFAEAARCEAVPLYDNSKKHHWVLMTRNAA
ncbi:MAG: GNAT family N-acetyltransferase [Rhizobium sp. 63-7]|nr:MAG: GNAT family N-acetyltransferase [Rhizobium sp. 63-7]